MSVLALWNACFLSEYTSHNSNVILLARDKLKGLVYRVARPRKMTGIQFHLFIHTLHTSHLYPFKY